VREFLVDDGLGDLLEDFCNVEPVFGGSLEELEAVFLRECLSPLSLDYLIGSVALIRDENLGNVGVSMLLNLLKPVGYVRECLLVRAVVHQDDAHRALVVGLRYRSEPLLPRSVPYLQLYSLLVNHDLLNLEINPYRVIVKFCLLTDRRHVAHWETVLSETQQQTCLSHA
jgi:hypothetical protein